MRTCVNSVRAKRRLAAETDEGFTLIELLVVLLIIGILLAIAIPTFLTVTKGANNTAAQSNLQTALTGAKTFYTENSQTYSGIDTYSASYSSITAIDTGLSYVGTNDSTGPHVIGIQTDGNNQGVILVAFSNGTNDCWGIVDLAQADSPFTTVWGIPNTGATGTYYFVVRNTTPSNCYPHVFSNAVESTNGFPTG